MMRQLSLSAVLFVTLIPASAQNRDDDLAISPAEQYLQAAADRERAALNLPPLRRDPALVRAARMHALEMAEHKTISHQFPGEPDLAARGSAAGARFSVISENVAESSSTLWIHEAWMKSEGHRHNLLDPHVDTVGIAVVERGKRLFAVEDFEKVVEALTLDQQESAVARVLSAAGIPTRSSDKSARRSCAGQNDWTRGHGPSFVMRYTTANLNHIPEDLASQIASGKFGSATVGACSKESSAFTMYTLAVLLYSKQ